MSFSFQFEINRLHLTSDFPNARRAIKVGSLGDKEMMEAETKSKEKSAERPLFVSLKRSNFCEMPILSTKNNTCSPLEN